MDDDSDAGSDILGYVLGRAEKQKPSGLQPKAKATSAKAKRASATSPRKQASMLPTVVKPAKVRSSSSSKKAAVNTSAKAPSEGTHKRKPLSQDPGGDDADPKEYLHRNGKAILDAALSDVLTLMRGEALVVKSLQSLGTKELGNAAKDLAMKAKSLKDKTIGVHWKLKQRVRVPEGALSELQKFRDLVAALATYLTHFAEATRNKSDDLDVVAISELRLALERQQIRLPMAFEVMFFKAQALDEIEAGNFDAFVVFAEASGLNKEHSCLKTRSRIKCGLAVSWRHITVVLPACAHLSYDVVCVCERLVDFVRAHGHHGLHVLFAQ